MPVLKEMFPTKSDAVINDVIISVQGNLDAAIESLLEKNEVVSHEQGMYKPRGTHASIFSDDMQKGRPRQCPMIRQWKPI